ncbi:MAG: alpha-ketoglutarate-dependent dioxygenase AlkB [Anaerolineae bacterium]|nr:alpha-ketoglutarate-dependent dioxygenase AlkB [Anaerolineae bacterium]
MTAVIPGLHYVADFVTPAEQAALLAAVDAQPWLDTLRRRVQHYGYLYDYRRRTITPEMFLGPLPAWAQALAQRFEQAGLAPWPADQMIVNEYWPGQGIALHVDCEPCFEATILSLSLGAACVMDFVRLEDGAKQALRLAPGSLLVLTGEARYAWQHGIAARRRDVWQGVVIPRGRRVSLTFRRVVAEPAR